MTKLKLHEKMYPRVTNKLYQQVWKSWEHKLDKTVRGRCFEGVVGLSYDDFMSTARLVMLRSMRTCRKNMQFSTYLYNNLFNTIKIEQHKFGVSSERYRVGTKTKKEEKKKVIYRARYFKTMEEAMDYADDKKREGLKVFIHQPKRNKWIPSTVSCSLHAPNEDGKLYEECLGVSDVLTSKQIVKRINTIIPRGIPQRIIKYIYYGETLKAISEKVGIPVHRVKPRVEHLKRTIINNILN